MDCDPRDPQWGAPGKLRAAAEHWVADRFGGRDELDDDLEIMGLSDQVKRNTDAPFIVWLENAPIVKAFLALESCWGWGQMMDGTERMTLYPERIKSTLELLSIKRRDWETVFDGLKVMELAALKKLHTTS